MSSDLVWLLVRDNSSFLVKRNGVQFSKEKGNLLNKNSLKYSGLATKKTVDISAAPKGVTVTLNKKAVPASRVSKSSRTAALTKAVGTTVKSVRNLVGKFYRPDLTKVAVARLRAIAASQKPVMPKAARKARNAASRK